MFTKQGSLELVEPSVKDVIEALQEKGIKMIGETAYLVGPLPGITRHEEWAVELLKEFNIDFSKAFPEEEEITFSQLPPFRGHHPCFYQGILHANGRADKGSKREAFLSFLNLLKKDKEFTPQLLFQISDLDDAFLSKEEAEALSKSNILYYRLKYCHQEVCNPDKIVDSETFKKAWIELRNKVAKENFLG
jgi:hypothetical protein